MVSAFGVEHTVSKGVPKGLAKVAGKYKPLTADSKELTYAHQRMLAHKHGRLAQISAPRVREVERTRGHTARVRSRGLVKV